jgi:hypothetical protein
MTGSPAIEAASVRLNEALNALEAAVERRCEAERSTAGLDAQLQALGSDRARLATELDAASARARRLEEANRDVAQRLDRAMETIRTVIGSAEE